MVGQIGPRNQLSDADKFKVCTWLQNEHACGHLTPKDTYETLADKAQEVFGIKITEHNMRGCFLTVGIGLPEAPKSDIETLKVRVSNLETEIRLLKLALGVEDRK